MEDFLYLYGMTRKSNNVFLYLHTRKDNGMIFYVGIGVGKRPYMFSGKQRGWRWKQIYQEAGGCDVVILCDNLTWVRACELEILMISFYGRETTGEGNLVNFTKGGEGRYGTKKPQEEINKIKDKQRKTYEEFTQQLEEKWGFKLFVDRDTYIREYDKQQSKITIECSVHGAFKRTAYDVVSKNPRGCYECMKIRKSNSMKNHIRSEEHCKNLSISKKGINNHTEKFINDLREQMKGSGNRSSKLTDDDVRWIRQNYISRDKQYGVGCLVKKFNVSKGTIISVVTGKRYTNVI